VRKEKGEARLGGSRVTCPGPRVRKEKGEARLGGSRVTWILAQAR
jgi:hypothetical protein